MRNKEIKVSGFRLWPNGDAQPVEFKCIITNDEKGKTLSINNGVLQFTIPFETIEGYLKRIAGIKKYLMSH